MQERKPIHIDLLIMKLESIMADCGNLEVFVDTEARCFPAHLIAITDVMDLGKEAAEAMGENCAILSPDTIEAPHFRLPQVLRVNGEYLARRFHMLYEMLASEHDYETRKASAKPWSDVPENNKKLMIDVATHIADEFQLVDFSNMTPLFATHVAIWVRECKLGEILTDERMKSLADHLNEAMEEIVRYRDNPLDTTLMGCPNCKKAVNTGWMCCPWCAHPVGDQLDKCNELAAESREGDTNAGNTGVDETPS